MALFGDPHRTPDLELSSSPSQHLPEFPQNAHTSHRKIYPLMEHSVYELVSLNALGCPSCFMAFASVGHDGPQLAALIKSAQRSSVLFNYHLTRAKHVIPGIQDAVGISCSSNFTHLIVSAATKSVMSGFISPRL